MRRTFAPILLAAGLALAGVGQAAAPTAAAPVAPTTTAPAAIAPTDANLAMDGAPAMSAVASIGQPTNGKLGLQPQVTKNGLRAHWMHDRILLPLITVISLFVLLLLFWVSFRYRASRSPVASRTSHNTAIEIVWTLAPVVILVLIAVPSIGLLQAQFKPAPKNAVTLKAIGNQWYWSYQYPDNGGFEITANMLKEQGQVGKGERFRTAADGPRLLATDNRIVLPVGVPIRLITTANDVIHSWAVPAFWIKLDAIPGRLNETSFTIEKPGVYFGQCSELCGARHAFMPITVEAVPPAQFAAWVKAKGGTMPGSGGAAEAKPPETAPVPAPDTAPAANAAGPVENITVAPTTSNQAATANPAGAGTAGN
jgi:cytochrome c oxidase subunit 2